VAPPPTIVLFDIDGTLILTGGAGRRAFERAFRVVVGRSDMLGFSFGGMTDRGIARLGLEGAGIAFDEPVVERLFDTYVGALHEELASKTNYVVMPGVHAALRHLRALPRLALGLGTGNLRRGAEAKLRHGALWEPFTFGGFGCDAEDRTELLRIGAERGARELGLPLAACRTVVVGDTVRDVVAAHGIGAACVAVETGGVKADVLEDAGADAVFRDLEQPGALDALLTIKR
jgi:phosphoglycolate phosphatase-like HAD superfamily hydrolase